MQRQARAANKPEMELRRILHRRGLRYRVDYPLGLKGNSAEGRT